MKPKDDIEIQLRFGQRIRALRNARGFSQEALADKAGIHWTYLGGIESRRTQSDFEEHR